MTEPGQETPPQDPPATPPEDAPKTFSEAEVSALVESKLKGQGKEIAKLQAAAQELADLKSNQAAADAEAAASRGEFEKLWKEASGKTTELQQQLDAHAEKVEGYEKLLSTEVKSQVDAIEDETLKATVKATLKGRPVMDQRAVLAAVLVANGAAPAPVSHGGPGGPPRTKEPTTEELANNPGLRQAAALNHLQKLKAGNL